MRRLLLRMNAHKKNWIEQWKPSGMQPVLHSLIAHLSLAVFQVQQFKIAHEEFGVERLLLEITRSTFKT